MERRKQVDNKTDNKKICPFEPYAGIKGCYKRDCQLWIKAPTIEHMEIENCAFVIMALKDSDGMIPV